MPAWSCPRSIDVTAFQSPSLLDPLHAPIAFFTGNILQHAIRSAAITFNDVARRKVLRSLFGTHRNTWRLLRHRIITRHLRHIGEVMAGAIEGFGSARRFI